MLIMTDLPHPAKFLHGATGLPQTRPVTGTCLSMFLENSCLLDSKTKDQIEKHHGEYAKNLQFTKIP